MKKKILKISPILFLLIFILLAFIYYEDLFPRYKHYQNVYASLEEFRSTYTKQEPPPFEEGIKEIILPGKQGGQEQVERCITCHLAVKLPYFSPTKIVYNINGEMSIDAYGIPITEPNPDYIWERLEKTIADLRNEKSNQALKERGETSKVQENLAKASALENLSALEIDGQKVDMRKMLSMHPLLGAEVHPFDLHPLEEYGCCSCHSGNGSSINVKSAHGPIFDGSYEIKEDFRKPRLKERDPQNDPRFATIFNATPKNEALYPTPILVGPLMQAKCMECHQASEAVLNHMVDTVNVPINRKSKQLVAINEGITSDKEVIVGLLNIMWSIKEHGCEKTIMEFQKKIAESESGTLKSDYLKSQLNYITLFHAKLQERGIPEAKHANIIIKKLQINVETLLGSKDLALSLEKGAKGKSDLESYVNDFLEKNKGVQNKHSIFGKFLVKKECLLAVEDYTQVSSSLSFLSSQKQIVKDMASSVEPLIYNFKRGKELFINQACYSCHRIANYSRGNLGPDLTNVGVKNPWYIKLSIVWPQGKTKHSTMPTFKLDPEDVQDLMTFLLAQKNSQQCLSPIEQKITLKDWESGEKLPWEEAIEPTQVFDLNYAMTVFATEGCASCHKLQGFQGNVNFKEKKNDLESFISHQKWFKRKFPEQISGYQLVSVMDIHKNEIDEMLVEDNKKASILEIIQEKNPKLIETFYPNFQYASRAKNDYYADLIKKSMDAKAKRSYKKELADWKARVHKVLIMYIQTYGLGRDLAPHLNWSGVYRDNEWLMGHFLNPQDYTPRSFMPSMPFDESKFYCLINMLHILGRENRDDARRVWNKEGFNPEQAYDLYCSQCHGDGRRGNGPVSEMLYPIPKNLRNTTFLLNLTKEQAINSITHGVKGTPMPPWGEVIPKDQLGDQIPVLTESQIKQLVDWLYQGLPKESLVRTSELVPKWQYTPQAIIEELNAEGGTLQVLAIDKPIPSGSSELSEYFDLVTNPDEGAETLYYLKEKFFTQENIEAGEKLFVQNCAACHGKEATGMGARSSYMTDAKPRMLTNLSWLHSKDDLCFLRSIKFGIPGTSMTPWGDQTSVQQRMQLVIFIRSLSEEKNYRENLMKLLYNTFEKSRLLVEEVRSSEYIGLDKIRKEFDQAYAEKFTIYEEVQSGNASPEEAGKAYAKELTLHNDLRKLQSRDQLLIDLNKEIKFERDIYYNYGLMLIEKKVDNSLMQSYFSILESHDALFVKKEGVLLCLDDQKMETVLDQKLKSFVEEVDVLIHKNEKEIEQYKKILSKQSKEELKKKEQERKSLMEIKESAAQKASDAKKSRIKQCDLYSMFMKDNA